ncbi:hypothetical protein [Nonomuraea sediminis]|uniref:hypothetical protein n=1 Tax=Nonomuraea sediminis TaxID=2835864 RepID=UPI001BDD701B|nr:hypothetical protein [Nonomuraea sediminis]
MRRITLGALIIGAFLAAGTTAASASAAPPAPIAPAAAFGTSLGPYEYESGCLSAGNRGIENGEWSDFECVGSYGAWYIHPVR